MRYGRYLTAASVLLLAGLGGFGCGNPVAIQIELHNEADNFLIEATVLSDKTQVRAYTWENTGTAATVSHLGNTSSGTARLEIHDGAGALVYDKVLLPNVVEPTATGVAGSWHIRLTLTGYSGALSLGIQKL